MLNIIGNRKIFLTASSLLVLASIAALLVFGLKQGIDFTGGTLWQIKFASEVPIADLRDLFKDEFKINEFSISSELSAKSFLIRLPETTEENHQLYIDKLSDKFGDLEELSFETIGPLIGQELKNKSVWAFILVLLTISLYVALVFRKVSQPVSSWKYGIITLVTLFHDAIIPIGLTALLGYLYGIEVGINLVVATLVIIGFSVHDTIVVLDRTRENLKKQKGDQSFTELVNNSVNQTLARSINTSLTLVLVLIALYLLGPASLSYFILIILIGTVIGTYSSICVASSLLVIWKK